MAKVVKERHYEHPDPTPVRIPAGFKRPETLAEQVRRLVRSERFRQEAAAQGFESFEEADDFDVDDDPPDPATPYEPFFDPALGREVTPHDVLRNRDGYGQETESRVKAAKTRRQKNQAPTGTPHADPPSEPPQEPEKPGS